MDNIPSIIKIEYITPDKIDNFYYSPGESIDISNYLNGSFQQLSISGTASLKSSMQKNDAGILFEVKSAGMIKGKSESDVQTLHTLSNRGHVYRLTDTTGKQYLVGTNNNPAKFNYNDNNDQDPTGSRGYTFDISWNSTVGIIYLA